MSGEGTRKLAAILMADIAGYSRLMGADEKGTRLRVQQLSRELVEPTIAEHRGWLVKTGGDSFLAMFDSPVEAVRCAIVIQQNMVGRNLETPKEQRLQFRIGVNLGDVIVETNDVFGEGVNVASRLEQLAEPGNIYISGGVYEQIRYKLVCGYQSLGDRKVKNIVDPVPIYRVLPDPAAFARATWGGWMRFGVLGAASFVVACLAWIGWNGAFRPAGQAVTVQGLASSTGPSTDQSASPAPVQHDAAVPSQAPPRPDAAAAADAAPNATMANTAQPARAPAAAPAAAVVPPASGPRDLPSGAASSAQPAAPIAQAMATLPRPVSPQEPSAVAEPEMILIVGGSFQMGSNEDSSEQPVHSVRVGSFLMSKYPVTMRHWRACVSAKVCTQVQDRGDDAAVDNVSWDEAKLFARWLSQATHQSYRLPSEAEWEYAARGGTNTRFWWGNAMKPGLVNCSRCNGPHEASQPVKVGLLPPNPFGLSDIGGGLAEWVEDCWHKNYAGAPTDGSPWLGPDCKERVLRGGSWRNDASYARPSSRDFYDPSVRYPTHTIRLARAP